MVCYSLSGSEGEVVEPGDAIRFRPQPHLSRVSERVVRPLQDNLPIERDRKVIALKICTQRVPLVALDLDWCALLLGAPACDRMVDRDVVFKGIGPGDVVVVEIPGTPEHAARLIFRPRHS